MFTTVRRDVTLVNDPNLAKNNKNWVTAVKSISEFFFSALFFYHRQLLLLDFFTANRQRGSLVIAFPRNST